MVRLGALSISLSVTLIAGCVSGRGPVPAAPIESRQAEQVVIERSKNTIPELGSPDHRRELKTMPDELVPEVSVSVMPRSQTLPPVRAQAAADLPALAALIAAGKQHERAGDNELAIASYERALRIKPQNALVWYELARGYFSQGDNLKARSMAHRSLSFSGADALLSASNWQLISAVEKREGDLNAARLADEHAARFLSNLR